MKVSPGLVVMRTVIPSERTVVPPVTALRSPPDSRMTGADSPVMADSSTVAMPSTTSPSPGMISFGRTTTRSPIARSDAATVSKEPSGRRRTAVVVFRVARNVAAWALPRPSATASAMLAKRTVAQSQTATAQANHDGSTTACTVVTTEPTHTTNMTGLRQTWRGSSLATAWGKVVTSCRASCAYVVLDRPGRMSASPRACPDRAAGSLPGVVRDDVVDDEGVMRVPPRGDGGQGPGK